MSQLNNLFVSSSYQGLLKLTDSTNGLTNTLQYVQDGSGNNGPLQMSLTSMNLTGSIFINNIPVTGTTSGTSGTSGSSGSSGSDGTSGTSGSSGDGFSVKGAWTGTTTYVINDVVLYGGQSYASIQNGNLNKQPSVQPAWWTLFSAAGTSGTSGTSGSNGSDGSSGTSGSNGSDGSSGTSGTDGSTGSSGSDGSSGTSGSNGTDGSSGTSGSNGTDGSSGTSGLTDKTGLITTGSIVDTQQITGSLILGNTVISGSLVGNTVNGGLIQIRTEASLSGSVPLYITSSSPVSQSNLIFGGQGPTPATLSGSIVISGSNNIMFNNARTATVGSYGYIGNNNIVYTIPTLNTASLVSPTVTSNILNNISTLNFTTSSVLGVPSISFNYIQGNTTLNHQSSSVSFTNNIIGTNITSTANTTTISAIPAIQVNLVAGFNGIGLNHNSSSINYQGNIGGGMTVTNNYTSSVSTAVNNIAVQGNIFQGSGNVLVVSGSNSGTRRVFTNNTILGINNRVNSEYSASVFTGGHLTATSLLGQNLIVSASHTSTTVGGTVMVGRFNATGSLQESSQETVFVVGTGTSDGNRRNALRIDSNNNSNFTGSVNISGSLLLNGVAVSSDRNGLITTGSAGNTQQITGSINVQQNISIASGSLNLNNAGQSSISNQGTGRNVMYVDNQYFNFFFGNVPKGQSGRFSGDTGNFIVSPTYAAFQTGSNNILLGTGGIGLISGSNNLRIGGEPNFGSSDYSDTLYIGGTGGVNTNIIQKSGASSPLQLGYNTQVTGSLRVSGDVMFASGSNKTMGTVALDGGNPGSVTVTNSLVTANSLIFLTKQTLTNAHMVAVSSKGTGTFTITSNGNGDADTVAYQIINPA